MINPNTYEFDLQTYTKQSQKIPNEMFYRIDYCICVYNELHDPMRLHYLTKMLYAVQAIDYPIQIRIIHDQTSEKALLDYIQHIIPDADFWCRPPVPENIKDRLSCEWGMIWAYNKSKADFVCFNHSDDIPNSNRIDVQLQSFMCYPNAALSLAGMWLAIHGINKQIGYHEIQIRGSPHFGVPSSYMFNKHIMPTIEPNWNEWKQFACCMDLIIIMNVLANHQVVAVHYPLFVYNFHGSPVPRDKSLIDDQNFLDYIKRNKKKWDLANFKIFEFKPDIDKIRLINQQFQFDNLLFKIWHTEIFEKGIDLPYLAWIDQYYKPTPKVKR
jgi:hypothetical protein